MSNYAPTESKVYGATFGGGIGAALTTFVLWLLGVTVWNVTASADLATAAISAVPLPVTAVITAVLTVGLTYLGGWLTKHTPRPEEEYQPQRELIEDEPAVEDSEVEAIPVERFPVPEYAGPVTPVD